MAAGISKYDLWRIRQTTKLRMVRSYGIQFYR